MPLSLHREPVRFLRTVLAVERFFAISKAMAVERIDVLATAAVRNAPNRATLIDALRDQLVN